MGKKKWTGPCERKRQHMHRANRGRGNRRGGDKSRGGDVNPMAARAARPERNNDRNA